MIFDVFRPWLWTFDQKCYGAEFWYFLWKSIFLMWNLGILSFVKNKRIKFEIFRNLTLGKHTVATNIFRIDCKLIKRWSLKLSESTASFGGHTVIVGGIFRGLSNGKSRNFSEIVEISTWVDVFGGSISGILTCWSKNVHQTSMQALQMQMVVLGGLRIVQCTWRNRTKGVGSRDSPRVLKFKQSFDM